MYSCRVVLEHESQEIFDILSSNYHEAFQPQDQFEIDLLENMINARWKIRRLEAAHTAEMNLTIAEHHVDIHYKFGKVDSATQSALTFRASAKNLEVLENHLERQQRIFLRSYRALRTHRGARNLPPQEQLSNLETGIPTNQNVEPPREHVPYDQLSEGEKFWFEPSFDPGKPSEPGLLRKIAIVVVLWFSAIASALRRNLRPSLERSQSTHATPASL
ncbi:MAG: hypothetical protein JST93_33120 [Acidobacteria bacterium]|nr:hypothetical protein [Acidobacteriota bacterium]